MTNRWQQVYENVQALLSSDRAVLNGTVFPRWIGNTGYFWYDRQTHDGVEFLMVEAATGTSRVLFTLAEIAALIDAECGIQVDRQTLLLKNLDITPSHDVATFGVFDGFWQFDLAKRALTRAKPRVEFGWAVSPDKTMAVLCKNGNLWIRDIASGVERAITTDGQETNAYSAPPLALRAARAMMGAEPEGIWSPDSRTFFTLQTDERHVPDFPLIDYAPPASPACGRPVVDANRASLPGDTRPAEFRMLAIDVASGRQIEARHPRLPATRMNDTPFSTGLAWWSVDNQTAYFVDVARGECRTSVIAFDVRTGACRMVFEEESDSYIELGVNVYAKSLVEFLPDTNELIWYSERSGHGHLYLYDLTTGALKNPITTGAWQVREILHVDPGRREVAIKAGGIAAGEDPYLCKPCIARLDGGSVDILSAEVGEHIVWRPGEFGMVLLTVTTGANTRLISGFSPDGNYFVETVGAIDRLPVSILRERTGRQIALLETADGSALPRHWRWPEPFTVKAADGVTDIYGLLYKPADYEPGKSYPLIDLIYGGPQIGYVPKSAFAQTVATLNLIEAATYAELGAFVFIVDGRGTAERERSFRMASHGAVQTASNLEDHIAAARALAARHPQIDLDRVGITGFSGGGYMTAMAMLRHGDFYKVGVAGGGNYDQALFWHGWGERYHGLYEPALYAQQAARTYATGLRGKLLLIHGLLDRGCHPAALFQLVQALIEANRDFDTLLLPRAAHEIPGYAVRKRLDYFVRYLIGEEPETDIRLAAFSDQIGTRMVANMRPPKKAGKG